MCRASVRLTEVAHSAIFAEVVAMNPSETIPAGLHC